jgi:hypothetical protein
MDNIEKLFVLLGVLAVVLIVYGAEKSLEKKQLDHSKLVVCESALELYASEFGKSDDDPTYPAVQALEYIRRGE